MQQVQCNETVNPLADSKNFEIWDEVVIERKERDVTTDDGHVVEKIETITLRKNAAQETTSVLEKVVMSVSGCIFAGTAFLSDLPDAFSTMLTVFVGGG